jgi:hypothetical protein
MNAVKNLVLILVGLVVVGLLVAMFVVKPGELKVLPPCLFHKLTGLDCPGCGATRAMQELLHGHLSAAFHDNALFVLSLPGLVWVGLQSWRNRSPAFKVSRPVLWVVLAVVAGFTVWRNLPAGAGFAP